MKPRRVTVVDSRTRQIAEGMVRDLPFDKQWDVTIEEHRESRSLAQNRLYWLWVGEIATHVLESTGKTFSSDEIHEWLRATLLPKKVISVNDTTFQEVYPSTSKLTVKEFRDYLERVEMYSELELGATLTHPDELYWQALMRGSP